MKRILAFLLAVSLLLSLAACEQPAPPAPVPEPEAFVPKNTEAVKISRSTDLMEGIQAEDVKLVEDLQRWSSPLADFGIALFQSGIKPGENALISPLSVLYALSMTANGADGETLRQMESVLGMSTMELNDWLHTYQVQLSKEEYQKLFVANGIWIKDDSAFKVEPLFLHTNADYYGAGLYKAPFDEATCEEINEWIEGKTAGMVKDVLDEIPEEAIMYLVNALAFDARWAEQYKETQVQEAEFTTEAGEKRPVEMMYSAENGWFLEDDLATGFLKWYAGYRYAFVAILPNEGVSVEEYVSSLSAEHLRQMLADPKAYDVNAALPKFETGFDAEMSNVLENMGMTDAFDAELADFSRLGKHSAGNVYISRVLHKTFISVAEQGTCAGAATVVEAAAEAALMEREVRDVILDRPFVYFIMDQVTGMPVFAGTLMDVQ